MLIPIAKNAFQKYAVFFKVALEDVSDECIQIGSESKIHLELKIDQQISEHDQIIIKTRGTPFRCLIIKIKNISNLNSNFNFISIKHWQELEIKNNIPAIYPESSGIFLPHELDLPKLNAVSFNKGCYTGQEIIARLHYRGKVKTTLQCVSMELPSPPIRGQDIFPNTTVVDYCSLGYNQYELLNRDHYSGL